MKFSKSKEELANNRICLFSYGSGLASAMFSIRVRGDGKAVDGGEHHKRFSLDKLVSVLEERKRTLLS